MNTPNPAIVTRAAARRLPRWVLLLLCAAYVLAGFVGRDPWKTADVATLGVVREMVLGLGDWWHPAVLGQAADVQAWLPYWLGAAAVWALPFLPLEWAVRLPFVGLLCMALACVWYSVYHLARREAAQPVAFAFGGEADPTDYARALADAGLLAFVACLGLAQLAHETTPHQAQLAFSALWLYAAASVGQTHQPWRGAALWALAAAGLALSGAPWLGAVLGVGWLLWRWPHWPRGVWWACLAATLAMTALAWGMEWPRRQEAWAQWVHWLEAERWRGFARLLLWFTWPAWPLALWTLWRWRHRLSSSHVALPLWLSVVAMASSWAMGGEDRALLMALPGLAGLAAFAVPTLSRGFSALIDWFALLFFSGCMALIWLLYLSMQAGVPAKPAANVAKLFPGFEPSFSAAWLVPALLATVAWLAVIAWRVGRHRPALWKSLVLSATGGAICWLLLNTLWMPLLNHAQSYRAQAVALAAQVPAGQCVTVQGLNQAQISGLAHHTGLVMRRPLPADSPSLGAGAGAGAGADQACRHLLVSPRGVPNLDAVAPAADWEPVVSVPRSRDSRENLLLYRRRAG